MLEDELNRRAVVQKPQQLGNHTILGFHAVQLNAAERLTLKPIDGVLAFHSGRGIAAPFQGETDSSVFSFEKKTAHLTVSVCRD